MAKADLARTGSTIRCAIYTRKSSDEGLVQEIVDRITVAADRSSGMAPRLKSTPASSN
jgi:hypothetical protein